MRLAYNLLTWLLLIPYAAFWAFRGFVNRVYWEKLGQRFGASYPNLPRCIWIHAVSVGEVVAAVPLIRAIGERFPDRELLVTTVTPTGAARVRAIFGDSVHHSYIPYEVPFAVNHFFSATNPELVLIMETEIWPNLYHGCGIRNIPLVLVSARISPKSVDSYRKLLPLFRETLSHGIIIAAQSSRDAERFISLGASSERTHVTGNIKFDIRLPADLVDRGRQLRDTMFPGRPVWVAASTHEGEETKVLDAHRALLDGHPDLLLILVPRHPHRFKDVGSLVKRRGFRFVTRTSNQPCDPSTEVLIGDTMGELTLFYAACDIAFVGGSLVPIGGHNLLEPAALGKPVLSGPHVFNAQEIAEMFTELGACRLVDDSEQLREAISELLENPEHARELGETARDILERNRGALKRLLDLLEPAIRTSQDE